MHTENRKKWEKPCGGAMDPHPQSTVSWEGRGRDPDAASAYVLHKLSFSWAFGSGSRHSTLLSTSVPLLALSSPPAIFSRDPGVSATHHPPEVFAALAAIYVYHSVAPSLPAWVLILAGHAHFPTHTVLSPWRWGTVHFHTPHQYRTQYLPIPGTQK